MSVVMDDTHTKEQGASLDFSENTTEPMRLFIASDEIRILEPQILTADRVQWLWSLRWHRALLLVG